MFGFLTKKKKKKQTFYFTHKGEPITGHMMFEDFEEAQIYSKKLAAQLRLEFSNIGIREVTDHNIPYDAT